MTSLTQALPLIDGIDNQICFLLIDYLTNVNVWSKQVFISAQYPYIKDDLASKQRPAVFAYPLRSHRNSFSFSQKGFIYLELHFSLTEQRIDLAQNVIQIANLIQLMNINLDFTNYMQPLMPGLFWFGKDVEVDYTRVYAKESVVKIKFDYNVDLLAYTRELQKAGYDITSPDEMIYVAAQELLETIAVLNPDQSVAFETH